MSQSAPQLWLLGVSHHETSLAERERLAMAPESLTPEVQARLKACLGAEELFTLATCNRLEVYAVGNPPNGTLDVDSWISQSLPPEIDRSLFHQHAYLKCGEAAANHLFEVASGLDSQMLGETEITGQVKGAYQRASDHGLVGKSLHRLLQKALQGAKWARSETGIGRGQVSLGNIAAELAERVCGNLADVSILLIGTGEVGKNITQALLSRGARRLTIAGRNQDRAQALADEFAGATILPFSHLQDSLPMVDVIISCTSAPGHILTARQIRASRKGRHEAPLFMIDLAVPRDIDAAVADWETFYLYNMDDLAAIANRNLAGRQEEVTRARAGLQERAARAWSSADPAKASRSGSRNSAPSQASAPGSATAHPFTS
ncbi:MAG: glutamyl-tRNA reductase [Opitutales bacterium]